MNPVKLRKLYETHFPDELFTDPVEAMYQLADIYDVHTLWALTGWDLESEISSVLIIKFSLNNYFIVFNSEIWGLKCLQARVDCTKTGEMKKIFTVLGYCLHYDVPPVKISGHFYGFNIKLCK